jgi:hypothetical protein
VERDDERGGGVMTEEAREPDRDKEGGACRIREGLETGTRRDEERGGGVGGVIVTPIGCRVNSLRPPVLMLLRLGIKSILRDTGTGGNDAKSGVECVSSISGREEETVKSSKASA